MDRARLTASSSIRARSRAPLAGTGGVRVNAFRTEMRTRIPVTRHLRVFGAAGTGENLASTGRIRELCLGRRAGPARPCMTAYILSHRV